MTKMIMISAMRRSWEIHLQVVSLPEIPAITAPNVIRFVVIIVIIVSIFTIIVILIIIFSYHNHQHFRQILGQSARNATSLSKERWSAPLEILFTRWQFSTLTFIFRVWQEICFPPGLFHVRAMQTTFPNRRASYFYWEELSLSGLHTGGGIVIVVTIIITMAA